MAQKIVAFVTKSFDPEDEAKISPITKFLESFSTSGFISQSRSAHAKRSPPGGYVQTR
jgi:hypothetical protein